MYVAKTLSLLFIVMMASGSALAKDRWELSAKATMEMRYFGLDGAYSNQQGATSFSGSLEPHFFWHWNASFL